MKGLNKEEFIKRSNEIYHSKYDYSKVDYVNTITKVCIICPIHGEFWQIPSNHMKGNGCKKCGIIERASKRTKDTEQFIQEAREVHGNKYDYSKVEYINSKTPVTIICHEKDEFGNEHSEFQQTSSEHLSGRGCPKCGGRYKLTTDEFIKRAKKIHRDKYDYSVTVYTGMNDKVRIICPEHGEFLQRASCHLDGQGCRKCGSKRMALAQTLTTEQFIEKAKQIHGDKYDYSKAKYVDGHKKVCIICSFHGEFWQKPNTHLSGCGCKECGITDNSISRTKTTKQFIEKAKLVHGDRYDYSEVEYVNNRTPVYIICHEKDKDGIEHGGFWQVPYHHKGGNGCPKCGISLSYNEDEIYNILKNSIECEVRQRVRNVISPHELDIFIPSLNIGIEYNGLIWHSEMCNKDCHYHLNKTEECKKMGIRLIHIFEDEYIEHKDIVLSKIRHILGKDGDLAKVYARKCVVREIDNNIAREFLEVNHIQGFSSSSIYLGCYYGELLVGVMTFKRERKDNNDWELTRFATDINYHCVGVGGKLFSYFVRNYSPEYIKSFADRRWTTDENNNLYTKLGFDLEDVLKPDYRYYFQKEYKQMRVHKFNFRKDRLHKKYGLPITMTEKEMCDEIGAYRIWDCGLLKYVWRF